MVALAASVLVVLYLIVPHICFRLAFSQFVPLRNFDRTRTEAIVQALLTSFFPFAAGLLLAWTLGRPFYSPDTVQLRRNDYKVVASALDSQEKLGPNFWSAVTRTSRRQGRLLVWYCFFEIAEGVGFGLLARSYGRLGWWQWAADKIVLPQISPWYVLLTPFAFSDPDVTVQADVLSTDGTLYQGQIVNFFLDEDGDLSGQFLTQARRYDRRSYLKDKDQGAAKNKDEYWKPIPGAKLCLFQEKILNMNLNYKSPFLPDIVEKLLPRILEKLLQEKAKASGGNDPPEGSVPKR